jgi:hypothetical protein
MTGYRLSVLIDRPLPEVFDYVATHHDENHPNWEPEVLAIRKVTDGPLRVGSEAVMTRRDFGYTRDVPYSVTEFEPERVIAMRSVERSLTFDIAFRFAPRGPEKTELITVVDIAASGLLRPLESVINAMFRRSGVSRANRLKQVVEKGRGT